MKLSELMRRHDLKAVTPPDGDPEIRSVRPLEAAGEGDLSFLNNRKYRQQAVETKATAVLTAEPIPDCEAVQLLCREPYAVLARILADLHPEPAYPASVHPSAVVDPSARIHPECHIGPHCVVEAGAVIGAGTVLVNGVTVGRDCRIGAACRLFPHTVLYHGVTLGDRVRIHANSVIGSDGFGYAQTGGIHLKVPQVAGVRIEDDVEIGSNVSIDRGALSDTVIGKGSKIDNLVQVAHGVKIGEHCLVISQSGISGSATLGRYTVLAGQVGVVGHVHVGDQVVVMGDSVVTKDLPGPGQYAGNPAVPHMQYQRQKARERNLAKLEKRLKSLESAVNTKGETSC
ncbi:UDP-3-O-(3-hydroxymyristoyl)glucosamine N-acyltransferase [Sulfidibacter corallicola]|uniref:UDP-3-O-acylglucosamine N-acyltransferase n=1 Tax=Sulfidibacter corallicola TaxID=2818388 RepID=A0A8A4TUC6_SULCO|nr:UDP-3-O-(3-hydroxymyristoyl)glucosamine N-acyltransferase [Sulfidibacter corallicola]QTD53559.1 UDP-3-O-(3-hydroxymyristoyl)glucosamine N-acyltransferase [Sulfidibacter corallicola]